MHFMHKYTYLINGVYLLTETPRPNLQQVNLPFNIFKDSIPLATSYIRWSDDGQTFGHSLHIQESEIVARAKREGFQVVASFIEEAKSAYHIPAQKRVQMQNMKQFILNNKNVKAVIFYEESRITRLIEDFVLYVLGPIKEARPDFKVYSTKIEGEWNENNPYVQARLSFAHEESVEKSRRASDYHSSVVNSPNPVRPGSRNPYGYSLTTKDNTIKTNDNKIIVILIFYLYSYGYSDRKIANLLNEADIPPPSMDAKGWNDSTIRYILNNRWYIGELAWFTRTSFDNSKKKPEEDIFLFKNHHEPLVGANLWNVTQFFRNYKQNKDHMDSPFILRDLIYCHECKEKLVTRNSTPAKSKKKYMYYCCPSCKKKISTDKIHESIFADFSLRWGRELKYYEKQTEKILNRWKKGLEQKINDLNENLEKLKYLLSTLDKNNEYYLELKEIFEMQILSTTNEIQEYNTTREQIDLLSEDVMQAELIGRFKQDIYNYTNEEKRAIFLLAIEKIGINFSKDNHIRIDYRLTPYVEIEDLMKQLDIESA
jgi:site-specific DNA recombinase